jgi:hypothetical protein
MWLFKLCIVKGYNLQYIALEASMLTITSPMQFLYTLSIQQNNKIKVTQHELEQQLNIFSFPVEILIDITIAKLSLDI